MYICTYVYLYICMRSSHTTIKRNNCFLSQHFLNFQQMGNVSVDPLTGLTNDGNSGENDEWTQYYSVSTYHKHNTIATVDKIKCHFHCICYILHIEC